MIWVLLRANVYSYQFREKIGIRPVLGIFSLLPGKRMEIDCVIKIGGSAITDKDSIETLNEKVLSNSKLLLFMALVHLVTFMPLNMM